MRKNKNKFILHNLFESSPSSYFQPYKPFHPFKFLTMSFYKGKRTEEWNYKGKHWKLSRSKIENYIRCPRCFYLDNKLGVRPVDGFPFNLNSAVDTLFKKEFDTYRRSGQPHPLMEQYGIKMVPFEHSDMDKWRANFMGITHLHEATGLTITGAVDDVWVDKQGVLTIADYKSTSKKGQIVALDQAWHAGYKRQMEIYQWLFRQNGFSVNDTGYFVYANGQTSAPCFNNRLDFEVTLVPYIGNDCWIEDTLLAIKECLESESLPESSAECGTCQYLELRKSIV